MEKDLQNADGIKKFTALVEEIRVCIFITHSPDHDHSRPMATVDVDDDGRLWFFTDIRSVKVEEVSREATVHLVYAHPGKESYLDVWGSATIEQDKNLMKKKWSPAVKVYFPDGLEDPNLGLLSVKPQQVYYWDAGTGKMMAMIKMAAALVSGNTKLAKGEQGKINVG